ncbi:endonuclease domain-containing protein [Blastomonas sp.]|uniref:endonuclease domain-containing protein n=1 Tax=Blastomonas sp. TaxID=1909299 RepID=UPI003593A94C
MTNHVKLAEFARELRNNPTPFEIILWKYLKSSQLGGYKFRRQSVIGPIICDFLCPSKGLIVEVDGDTHDPVRDAKRDARLADMGYITMRFTNYEVGRSLEAVLDLIFEKLQALPDRWEGYPRPHPNPSPKGEGLFE